MKKVLTIFAMFSVILLSGFSNNASAQSNTVEQEVANQASSLVQPSSIYDDATVIKPHEYKDDKTTRFTTTKYYKVKFDYAPSGDIPTYFLVSDIGFDHEIYVYDEKYLSVGTASRYKTEVSVKDLKTNSWYYIEVRRIGPATNADIPYKVFAGF